MQARTEDLLKLRDGEPIDPDLKARLLADPAACREIARLEQRRVDLRALPGLRPSAAAQNRVLAALAAMRAGDRSSARSLAHRVGLAAALAALAVSLSFALWTFGVDRPSIERTAATAPRQALNGPDDYRALIAESELLEHTLSELPSQRRIMRADTASTIVQLEDRIARIDEQLTMAAAAGLRPESRTGLWRERVDVMNALVQVRYAQSEVFSF